MITMPQGYEQEPSEGHFSGAASFSTAAEQVVAYLKSHTPLTDWSVSRVLGGEQVHIHVREDQLITPGARVPWNESFCSRMTTGAAHVVRNSLHDPSYSSLRAAGVVGAYAGYSITDDRGELFGVLCGVRREPLKDDELVDEQLVRLFSDLLSRQLELSRVVDRHRRQIQIAEATAQTDALTGLLNRRGWDKIVEDAQERSQSFGDAMAVAVIDLDGLKKVNDAQGHAAGDLLLQQASEALKTLAQQGCHIARYGGDEFTILANGISPAQASSYFQRFERALHDAEVSASIGFCAVESGRSSVVQSLARADELMYQNKGRQKKS